MRTWEDLEQVGKELMAAVVLCDIARVLLLLGEAQDIAYRIRNLSDAGYTRWECQQVMKRASRRRNNGNR